MNAILHYHRTGGGPPVDPPPPYLEIGYAFPGGYGVLFILAGTSRLWPRVEEAREAGLLPFYRCVDIVLPTSPGDPGADGMDYIANNVLGHLIAQMDARQREARKATNSGGGSILEME